MTYEWESSLISRLQVADQIENSDHAIKEYQNCLAMIPEPVHESSYATQIYMTMGEIYFLSGKYEQALDNYREAVRCLDGLGNPVIHMRLRQLQLERGNLDRARDELMRAYMGAGKMMFEGENPKYYNLIRDFVESPRRLR